MAKRKQKDTDFSDPDQKEDIIQDVLHNFNKKYGDGMVQVPKYSGPLPSVDSISTGSLMTDIAIGVGGFPRGRITEVFGPESSGKTTLCLSAAAEAQNMGLEVFFIDMEHALDPTWANRLGVDTDRMFISQPDHGEQALQILEESLSYGGLFGLIIIDSIAALTPLAEVTGDIGDSHVGLQARMLGQALRKINTKIKSANCAVVFTNQLREKVGITFGSPETTPGGRAMKFFSSVRIDIRRIQSLKVKGEVVGNRTRVKIKKNKVSPPFKEGEFDIKFAAHGIDIVGEILDIAVELGIIEKRGAYYRMKGEEENIGQGRENTIAVMRESPLDTFDLHNRIRLHYNLRELEDIPNYSGIPLPEAELIEEEIIEKILED